jgi:hypothetical protein
MLPANSAHRREPGRLTTECADHTEAEGVRRVAGWSVEASGAESPRAQILDGAARLRSDATSRRRSEGSFGNLTLSGESRPQAPETGGGPILLGVKTRNTRNKACKHWGFQTCHPQQTRNKVQQPATREWKALMTKPETQGNLGAERCGGSSLRSSPWCGSRVPVLCVDHGWHHELNQSRLRH